MVDTSLYLKTIQHNQTATTFTPINNGYEFLGWYLDNNTWHKPFDFQTQITTDITLYARWALIERSK
jgi:uncharacterized repeat protein (TIGR02543 family)